MFDVPVRRLSFAAADDDCADSIGEDVDGGAAHIEEAVGCPDDAERLNGKPDGGKNDCDRN